jgi:hypothetical protein
MMAQNFKETAHLSIDQEKFADNFEKIFGKQCKKKDCTTKVNDKTDEYCDDHKDD